MSTSANAIGALKTSSAPAPTISTLRAIPDAENFGARTAYKGKGIVEATFALRRGEGQPRYEKDCVFDFSKVSEEQLHLLAMYGAKVKVQAQGDEPGCNAEPEDAPTRGRFWLTFSKRAANRKTRSKQRSGR
jgi:hypothetical protein